MKTIITIIGMLLLISIVSAEVISVEPEVLENISMYGGETTIRNINITTDGNYLVYLTHKIIGNKNSTEGINLNYTSPIQVNQIKEIQIGISAFYLDSFTIQFNATTIGKEIEESSSNIYNETTEEIDTGIGLTLKIDSTGNGTIEIWKFKEDPTFGFGIPSLNIFFYIEASDSIIEGMNETTIEVSYSQNKVDALGIDENELKLYFYNETLEEWKPIHSWVDATKNIVYGTTDHFSLWGVFGEKDEPTIIYRSDGGGTRTIYVENKTTEIIKKPCEEEPCPTEEPDSDDELIIIPKESDKLYWPYYLSIVAMILIIAYLFTIIKKPSEEISSVTPS